MIYLGGQITSYTIAQANNQLATIVREAEDGNPVHLTRRGKPVVVLLNVDVYTKLCDKQGDWWNNYLKWHANTDFSEIANADINEVFADVRDRTTGRDFKLD